MDQQALTHNPEKSLKAFAHVGRSDRQMGLTSRLPWNVILR
jgi:hypothetical protein